MKRTRASRSPSRFHALEAKRTLAQQYADRDDEPFVLVDDHGEIVAIAMRKAPRYEAKHAAHVLTGEKFWPAPTGVGA